MTKKYEANKKWRQGHPKTRYAGKRKYYAQLRVSRKNSGQEWSQRELELITADDRPCDRELALLIGRSVQAIQIMRSRCRKSASED